MATILCVDDNATELLLLQTVLERAEHDVLTANHVPEALQLLETTRVDLIVSDYRMPQVTGIEFLDILARDGYDIPLIMSTAYATVEDAVSALKSGAIDYITKPLREEQLELAVDQALELTRLRRENAELRGEIAGFRAEREILGDSPAFERVMQKIAQVAPTRATVLLEGESGTGKELLARAIHEISDRRDRQYVAINCAALPENLIESMLFGHEKGAFTGALKLVEGAFERADGGTLMLDEVSEMRPDLQAKLLRVLQEQEFERLGGTGPILVDVRVIATTNRDLEAEVTAGSFRQDLFYRLNVFPIVVPPLRERKEDIPLLAQRFAVQAAEAHGKPISALAPDAVELLQSHTWPGNVRELKHAVERAVIMTHGDVVARHAFSLGSRGSAEGNGHGVAGRPAAAVTPTDEPSVTLESFNISAAERILIEQALEWTEGNRTRASELLGISDRTLRNKLNR